MVLFITLCGTLTVFSNVDIAGMDLAQAVQALYSAGRPLCSAAAYWV